MVYWVKGYSSSSATTIYSIGFNRAKYGQIKHSAVALFNSVYSRKHIIRATVSGLLGLASFSKNHPGKPIPASHHRPVPTFGVL